MQAELLMYDMLTLNTRVNIAQLRTQILELTLRLDNLATSRPDEREALSRAIDNMTTELEGLCKAINQYDRIRQELAK